MTFNSNFTHRHIPAYACSDILWWSAYSNSWNGVQILEAPHATLHIYTDASGNKGLGRIFGNTWYSSRCPKCFHLRDIQFKEMYVILQAILRWGQLWNGHRLIFHIDNMSRTGFPNLNKVQIGWDRYRKDVTNDHQEKALKEGCHERE